MQKPNAIAIRVKKAFLNPLTNRMATVDSEFNVPNARFWFRRIAEGDCVKIKGLSKKPASKTMAEVKNSKGRK